MIQISYQPAHDPFHAMFRFLRLALSLNLERVDFDALRILDYFLLFPNRAEKIKFKQGHLGYRRLAKKYADRVGYAMLPGDAQLFESMSPMQEAAAQTLADAGVIDPEALADGAVVFRDFPLPASLADRIRTSNDSEADLIDMLRVLATDYTVLGQGGLKARTGLLEHRYDAI